MVIILEHDSTLAETLAAAVDRPSVITTSLRGSLEQDHDLLVVGPNADLTWALEVVAELAASHPHVSVILVRYHADADVLRAAMRGGVRDVVAMNCLAELTTACHRHQDVAPRRQQPLAAAVETATGGQVISVFAAKGGVGKTTIATNLAVSLAAKGSRRVCLLDLDLAFGDVAIVLQLFPSKTLGDAVALSRLDEMAIQSLVTRHSAGLDVLAAPVDPGTSESISAGLVSNLLDVLATSYDIVVVDTPPAFTEQVLAAFDRTDHFVLPATLDIPSVKNLKLTLETLDLLGYPADKRHILLNRSDAKVGLAVQDVEKTLQTTIALQIPSSRAVPSSVNRGVPIVLDVPGHPVSVALRRFADSLAPRKAVAAALRSDRRVLGRLRRVGTSA